MSNDSSSLVVGVNLLFIQPERNLGTYTYVKNLLRAMASCPEVRIVLFTTARNHELISTDIPGETARCPVRGNKLIFRALYEQIFLSRKARKLGCDVLFCPGYLSPMWSQLPTVVTLHDMQFRDVPEIVPPIRRLAYSLIIPRAARRAARVIAVSHFSKSRIVKHLGLAEEKVIVTHEAPFKPLQAEVDKKQLEDVRQKFGLTKKYLLSVSSGLSHKNIPRLIASFHQCECPRKQDFEMVFVGSPPPTEQNTSEATSGSNVRFLGYLSDGELEAVYRGAYGFVLASYYEGFGLPVLEAMQFGVPVACSRAASLPEVAGEAAIYFDPFDTESIAQGLTALMQEQGQEREQRIASGYENLARFSWQACAEQTVAALRDAAKPGG